MNSRTAKIKVKYYQLIIAFPTIFSYSIPNITSFYNHFTISTLPRHQTWHQLPASHRRRPLLVATAFFAKVRTAWLVFRRTGWTIAGHFPCSCQALCWGGRCWLSGILLGCKWCTPALNSMLTALPILWTHQPLLP